MVHESRDPYLLIAAASDDEYRDTLADALSEALRPQNIRVVVAETIDQAAQVDKAVACVVILRPARWRTTSIVTTAMRCGPRYLIPVLAEPMQVPPANWSMTPLTLSRDSLTVVSQEISTKLHEYLNPPKQPLSLPLKLEVTTSVLSKTAFKPVPSPQVRRQRLFLRLNMLFLAVVVIGMGVLIFYLPQIVPARSTNNIPEESEQDTQTALLLSRPYVANTPGPMCDAGAALWSVPEQYKVVDEMPDATPEPRLVKHTSTQLECRDDGLLMKDTNQTQSRPSLIFQDPSGRPLPSHFRVEVTAEIIEGTDRMTLFLGGRNQFNPTQSHENEGYGEVQFSINRKGDWDIERFHNVTGQVDTRHAEGTTELSQKMILTLEVRGDQMTFFVNGKKLETITDNAYPLSFGISFGFYDSEVPTIPAVLFSQFKYEPLPTPEQPTLEATSQSL